MKVASALKGLNNDTYLAMGYGWNTYLEIQRLYPRPDYSATAVQRHLQLKIDSTHQDDLSLSRDRNHVYRNEGLSQDLEIGCPKFGIVKFWGVKMFKGDRNIFRFQL